MFSECEWFEWLVWPNLWSKVRECCLTDWGGRERQEPRKTRNPLGLISFGSSHPKKHLRETLQEPSALINLPWNCLTETIWHFHFKCQLSKFLQVLVAVCEKKIILYRISIQMSLQVFLHQFRVFPLWHLGLFWLGSVGVDVTAHGFYLEGVNGRFKWFGLVVLDLFLHL